MHGAFAMRAGRKRKQGRRSASGHLAREFVNYAAMAAEQPHRRCLPSKVRLSQDATTELGRLYLCDKITEPMYLAGEEYSRRIEAYRATTGGPRAMIISSRWSGCNPDLCRIDVQECECYRRTLAYQELFEVVNQCGHRVERVIRRIIGQDEPISSFELNLLSIGLTALAKHLHLSERGRR